MPDINWDETLALALAETFMSEAGRISGPSVWLRASRTVLLLT